MTLQLTAGAADRIAGTHEDAAETIDRSASGAPGQVDGGLGSAHLMEILAAVSGTAGEIAAINGGVAAQVRDAADDLGSTEAEVTEAFVEMNSGLR